MPFRGPHVGVHLHAPLPPVRAQLPHGLLDGHLGHELFRLDAADLVERDGLDELVGPSCAPLRTGSSSKLRVTV